MIKIRSGSFGKLSPGKFSSKAIATTMTGVAVAGAGLSVALVHSQIQLAKPASANVTTQAPKTGSILAAGEEGHAVKLPGHSGKKAALPSGISTGTSFWDPQTASGKPMAFHTVASPYWPLGTMVKVTFRDKSAIGLVEDFGPAQWAVAQHDPPAIIDLSEEMMKYLTGERSNSVPVKFQVLAMGNGPVYRHSGTGYDIATGASKK